MSILKQIAGKTARFASIGGRLALAFGIVTAPLQAQTASAQVVNTATATANFGSNGGTLTSAPDTATVSLIPATPGFDVTKTATYVDSDGTPGLSPGDTIAYEITAANTGNVAITGVTLTDTLTQNGTSLALDAAPQLDSGDTDNDSAIDVGETWVWTAQYTLTADNLTDGSPVENSVTVDGTGGSQPVTGSDIATIDLSVAGLMSVEKVAQVPTYARAGDVITWNITVTNTGFSNLTSVVVSDTTADSVACPTSGDETIALIAPSASEICVATYTVQEADLANPQIDNTVTVTASDGTNTLTGTDTATVTREGADLVTVKSLVSGSSVPEAGDVVTYEITVTNNGPAEATDVLFVDLLPAGLTATANHGTVSTGAYNATNGEWTIASLAAGTTATLTVEGTVNVDAAGTDIVNAVLPAQSNEYDPTTTGDVLVVTVTPPSLPIPSITGTVFRDINQDGTYNGGDQPLAGYGVELIDENGVVIATAVTGPDGGYSFDSFPAGTYDIAFYDPSGMGVGLIQDIVVGNSSVIVDQDQPIDPSGIFYNSATGAPISGVTVTLTDASGNPLPAACLLAGQQNQVTGADGEYRFDIVAGADPACPVGETEYLISAVPPSGYNAFPSTNHPAQSTSLDLTSCSIDAIPGGQCNVGSSASITNPANLPPYFLSFLIASGDLDAVYNHIPLDPYVPPTLDDLGLTKTASRDTVRVGDVVGYTITFTNPYDAPLDDLTIVDTLPAGLTYVPGSAQLDGVPITPDGNARVLEFGPLTISANGTLILTLRARVGQQLDVSELTNRAQVLDENGNAVTPVASATVKLISDPVFDCSTIIGRVFDDLNKNGYPDDGEPGLAGVRLATVKGLLITTDEYGRFNVPCAEIPDSNIGSNFILKLDTRTLPLGYQVTSENPRVVRVTRGKMTTLNFGAASARNVDLVITRAAFDNGTNLSAATKAGIERLAEMLAEEPSVLRLTYNGQGEDRALIRERLRAVEKELRSELRTHFANDDVWVETRIVD